MNASHVVKLRCFIIPEKRFSVFGLASFIVTVISALIE